MPNVNEQIVEIQNELQALRLDRRERLGKIIRLHNELNPDELILRQTRRILELEDKLKGLASLSREVEETKRVERLKAEKQLIESEIEELCQELQDVRKEAETIRKAMTPEEERLLGQLGIYGHKDLAGLSTRAKGFQERVIERMRRVRSLAIEIREKSKA